MNADNRMEDPLIAKILIMVLPFCSLAGLAALLRGGEPVTWRAVFGAILYSGIGGVSTAFILLHVYGAEQLYIIYGVSISSGLGLASGIDYAQEALRRLKTPGK